jgi:hypothetical protein
MKDGYLHVALLLGTKQKWGERVRCIEEFQFIVGPATRIK